MRMFKKTLAIVLAVVMALSCISVVSAAGKATPDAKVPETPKGFKSTTFKEQNTYQYADDELVRAIVVMDGEASANVAENGTTRAASNTAKLARQHQGLMQKMSSKKISYTLNYEYTELLNGIAVEAAYGDLDAISKMDGVKAVYIANHYDLPVYDVNMDASNEMTGLALAHANGYMGSGMVIAVLDTGMSANHEAFRVYDGMLTQAALSEADAKAYIADRGYGKYISEKIPFSYDYADVDDDAEDSTNGHGPHVSGIAAGYAEAEDGAITFLGAAPDAQLLEMKIFNDVSQGTSSDIYFAALEDAYKLGADVINMSIGAPAGFTYEPEVDDVLEGIFMTLEDAGIVCCISAGNENSQAANTSNWAGDGYVTADYADYGLTGSPATYDGNMSVASIENTAYPTYVLTIGDLVIPYYDSDENFQFYNAMKGLEANYVDCGFGYPEDFEKVDVTGKVALISRGDITFQEKVDNAAAAGACAALVYNNDAGVIYMSIDPYKIPAASLSQEDGLALLALLEGGETKGITVSREIRATSKPAKRADDEEVITATYAKLPEDGEPVVLYSAKDGVIMAHSAASEGDDEYITAWNQNTEAATVSGTKLTAAWGDAGILYALDMEDGTWAFVDEYEYDFNDEMYCLYNDGWFVGAIGDPSADGDYLFYELVASGDGYLFKNVGSELYLMIEDGMFYDTEDASEATVLSFYVVDTEDDPDAPPIDPLVGEGRAFEWTFEASEGEFVLVNAATDMAMSNDVITGGNGKNYRAGEAVSPVSGIVTTDNEDLVWTLEATDGGYYIKNADGDTLSCATGGLDFGTTDNVWAIEANDDGTFFISSTTAKGTSGDPKRIEWYDQYSEFSVYYINDSNTDLFAFDLYKASDEPIVPPAPPVDTDAPVIKFPVEMAVVDNADAWLMSDFSSWGCTPSLTLKPTITGVGGDVASAEYNTEDGYVVYSGTSMSAPNVTGYMAVLLSALAESEDLTKPERAAKAEAIAQSTAWVLEDADSYIYSPRKQGSGLIDIVNALNTNAYITEPIQNLFDNVDGEWEFTVTVKNDADYAINYTVTPLAMYDYPTSTDWSEAEDGSDIRYYNTLTSDYLTEDDAIIDCPETVTVPAGGTADVTVKITLTAETKELFDEIYPNGNFIEGYVFLTPEDENESEIHATFMGFYGDWTKAPVMEQHDWREVVDLDTWLQTTEADEDGNTYYDYGYTYLDVADFEINTDINLAYVLNYEYLEYYGQLMGGYAGDNLFAYADFNEKHIAISEGADGICDTLYMMPMNLRNCRHMIMVVSDAKTGEVYYVDDTEYLPKSTYDSENGYWENSGLFIWDGTDAEGYVLDSDTVVDVSYYCNIAYGEDALYTGAARDENGMVIPEDFVKYANMKADASDYLEWNFQCTVDNDVPEFTYEYDEATKTLTVTATDNEYVAYVALYEGDEVIDEAVFSEDEAGKTCTAVFENVPTDALYELDVVDYASNIAAENVILGDVETATVKLVFPEGFELDDMDAEFEVPVGATISMPYLYGEVDGAYYVAWLTEALEGTLSGEDLDSDEYAWIWDILYFEEDEVTITEDTTFYALMERPTGYADPSEELALSMYDLADWSGVWAFDGYDWTAGDDESSDYILTSDLSAFYLDLENEEEWIEYGIFGDGYLYGAPEDQLFTVETIGVDDYGYTVNTIQNADGKYLAITKDGELTLVDDASDKYAQWNIWRDEELYINIVWNCGADYVLLFNEETGEFSAVSADEATVDEPYNLYMFGPSVAAYEYFTAIFEPKNCPCWDYDDVDRDKWYHSAVDFVIKNDYMGSTSTTELHFEPNANVTRAMVASILYRINGAPEVAYTGRFADVEEGKWYTAAIEWCAQNGLASGKEDGSKFDPNGNVTRQELAVFMFNLAKYIGRDVTGKADLSSFADAASVPGWSKDYLAWAVDAGIISGQATLEGKTYLNPIAGAMRCEFASIIMRFFQK